MVQHNTTNKQTSKLKHSFIFVFQIYQCLKRYLKLDFHSTVTNYKSTLPVNISPKVTHAFLPTKQMLQWLLLRLQTFSKLFARIIKLSTVASHHIYGKLCLGWSMKQTIFMYGINARLLVISKYIVSKCIEWYDKLYDYLIIFESDSNFSYYSCPRDLKTWLGRDANVSPLSDKNQIIDNLFKMMEMKMRSGKKTEEEDETAVAYYKFLSKFFESDRATTILSQSDDVEEEEDDDGVVMAEDDDKRGKDTNENLNERDKKRKIENVEDVGGE